VYDIISGFRQTFKPAEFLRYLRSVESGTKCTSSRDCSGEIFAGDESGYRSVTVFTFVMKCGKQTKTLR
jgi:hypothetical protein